MSVEYGLYSFGDEVTNLCCDLIRALTNHIHDEAKAGKPTNQLMAPFLNVRLLCNYLISDENFENNI